MPKNVKYAKMHKGRCTGVSKHKLNFGSHGLRVTKPGRIKSNQIEAARKVIKRQIKKQGNLYIRVFPHIPVTKKPLEVRMGKGKGSVSHWVARVKKNQILFELGDVPLTKAKEILLLASTKLPLSTEFITK